MIIREKKKKNIEKILDILTCITAVNNSRDCVMVEKTICNRRWLHKVTIKQALVDSTAHS